MTRGALTTFSIANDVSKYFAIIPAAFVGTYPVLAKLNVMRPATPSSAILSAVIFNALVIVFLIPLALRGVKYKPQPAAALLRRNLGIYGVGGLLVPFVGIKLIDLAGRTASNVGAAPASRVGAADSRFDAARRPRRRRRPYRSRLMRSQLRPA